MDEPGGSVVARPRIQWGEAASAHSRQQEAEPIPVGDALTTAAATLEHERQKHENRYVLGTPRLRALSQSHQLAQRSPTSRYYRLLCIGKGSTTHRISCAGQPGSMCSLRTQAAGPIYGRRPTSNAHCLGDRSQTSSPALTSSARLHPWRSSMPEHGICYGQFRCCQQTFDRVLHYRGEFPHSVPATLHF